MASHSSTEHDASFFEGAASSGRPKAPKLTRATEEGASGMPSAQVVALSRSADEVVAFGCEPRQLNPGTRQPEKVFETQREVGAPALPTQESEVVAIVTFTVAQAAEMAGVSRQALLAAITRKRLAAKRVEADSGHNKGRYVWHIESADLFTFSPTARDRWETSRRKEQAIALLQGPVEPLSRMEPVVDPAYVQSFQDWQRKRMDARVAILRHIDKVAQELTSQPHPRWKFRTPTRDRAVLLVCADALSGRLPDDIQALIPVANARSGASGDRSLSRRTLQRWAAEAKQGMEGLAPKAVVHPEPLWAQPLLDLYRQPQKPSLRHVTIEVLPGLLPPGVKPPSYDAARRWLDKVGTVERERGRMLPRELKTRLPFVRRTFADLLPLDVVSADGHTFDAEVQHPETGRPFRPEMTAFIDIATRKVIGWSVALAECAITVGDAWRHAATSHGVFAIFYTDNGSGYVNEQIQALAARLGTRLENSIPYNSQARGVIERLNKTLWIHLCAKHLPTYVGKDMDRQARQIVYKHTRKVEDSTGPNSLGNVPDIRRGRGGALQWPPPRQPATDHGRGNRENPPFIALGTLGCPPGPGLGSGGHGRRAGRIHAPGDPHRDPGRGEPLRAHLLQPRTHGMGRLQGPRGL